MSSLKREQTKQHLLATALRLFKEVGFDKTTMRGIAEAAGMSLGAAYYSFRSKEDLVLSYYQKLQSEHEQLIRAELPKLGTVAKRLQYALTTKVQLIADDREFLGCLFRFVGEPDHPLTVFSDATQGLRNQSIANFLEVLQPARLEDKTKLVLAHGLWAMHLLVVLYCLHDKSPKLKKTYRLIDELARLVDFVVKGSSLPGMITGYALKTHR